MFEKQINNIQEVQSFLFWIADLIRSGLDGGPVLVTIKRPPRTIDQNKKMWPMLKDISEQVVWDSRKLKTDDWKDLLTAAWKERDCAPGINGGIVFFGIRTSKLNKNDFSELIEFIYSFGADKNVKWSEGSQGLYREVAPAIRTRNSQSGNQGVKTGSPGKST